MQKLSWREKYAGILVLLISVLFLIMQLASLAATTGGRYSMQNGSFVINKNEFFSDLRTYSVILAGIVAGWCLLKGKQLGWVLGLPILLFILTLMGIMTAEQAIKLKHFDKSMTGYFVIIFLVFWAVLFLLLPSARQKYRVSTAVLFLTLVLFAGLAGAYIYLQ